MSESKMRKEFEAAFAKKTAGLESSGADKEFDDFGGFEVVLLESLAEDRIGDTYRTNVFASAWWAWQASRESLVIELPQIVAYEACYNSLRDNEYAGLPDQFSDFDADEVLPLHRSDEVRAAIEAAGVKVKS
jgi:hypothetical protein